MPFFDDNDKNRITFFTRFVYPIPSTFNLFLSQEFDQFTYDRIRDTLGICELKFAELGNTALKQSDNEEVSTKVIAEQMTIENRVVTYDDKIVPSYAEQNTDFYWSLDSLLGSLGFRF